MSSSMQSAYGTHRVVEPLGVLPQGAWKIDNSMVVGEREILIDVLALNVDAASFTQIKGEAGGDAGRVGEIVADIVARRGKLHNPVTGSGGMLIGRVREIGQALAGKTDLKPGDRIATLVSLSLTPLRIDAIRAIHLDRDQIEIDGPGHPVRNRAVCGAAGGHSGKDGARHPRCGRGAGADRPPGQGRRHRGGHWWGRQIRHPVRL